MEFEVAKAAIRKLTNTFIAAETMIGKERSLRVFAFFVLKRKDFYCREIPVNCTEVLILHNLKKNVW